jgi:hypothetical protein
LLRRGAAGSLRSVVIVLGPPAKPTMQSGLGRAMATFPTPTRPVLATPAGLEPATCRLEGAASTLKAAENPLLRTT